MNNDFKGLDYCRIKALEVCDGIVFYGEKEFLKMVVRITNLLALETLPKQTELKPFIAKTIQKPYDVDYTKG